MLRVSSAHAFMNKVYIELWDVLCIFSYSLLQTVIGLHHAWPITAVAAGVSSIDRDMLINEVAAAAFMLRQACGAARVSTGPTVLITFYAGALACAAHFKPYLTLHYTYRRAAVLNALATSTLLLHGHADPAWLSVVRLVLFVSVTRYDQAVLNLDAWDTTAQKVWLLIVPWYALILFSVYPFVYYKNYQKKTPVSTQAKRKDPYYDAII